MRDRASRLLGAVALTLPILVAAHHSSAMFDKSTTITLSATVREFQWTSPHVWIQVYVEGGDGSMEEWSIEGSVPNRLYRQGWRPHSFQPGQEITLLVNPMKDGTPAGLFVGARFPDGTTLGRVDE